MSSTFSFCKYPAFRPDSPDASARGHLNHNEFGGGFPSHPALETAFTSYDEKMQWRLFMLILTLTVGFALFLSRDDDPDQGHTLTLPHSSPLRQQKGPSTPAREVAPVASSSLVADHAISGQTPQTLATQISTQDEAVMARMRRGIKPDVLMDEEDLVEAKGDRNGPQMTFIGIESWELNPGATNRKVWQLLGITSKTDCKAFANRLKEVDIRIQELMSAHQTVDHGEGSVTVTYGPFASEAASLREEVELALRNYARNPANIDAALEVLRARYFGYGLESRMICKTTDKNGRPSVTITQLKSSAAGK